MRVRFPKYRSEGAIADHLLENEATLLKKLLGKAHGFPVTSWKPERPTFSKIRRVDGVLVPMGSVDLSATTEDGTEHFIEIKNSQSGPSVLAAFTQLKFYERLTRLAGEEHKIRLWVVSSYTEKVMLKLANELFPDIGVFKADGKEITPA